MELIDFRESGFGIVKGMETRLEWVEEGMRGGKMKMMVSSFIRVSAKDMNSPFFMAAWYSMVYMCHIFLSQSIIDQHLAWFQVFAIVNSTAMNIYVHVSL